MSMTDPIADLLTRIRNAAHAGHKKLTLPSSRIKREVARILTETNYLRSYAEVQAFPQNQLVVRLRYTPQHQSLITGLELVSRSGLRRYGSAADILAMGRKLGVTVVSTSRGVMTDKEAGEKGIGGEILCRVW
jgi:small subunit ribosomal protein S8